MKRLNYKIIVLILFVAFTFSFDSKAQQFKPNTEVGILLGTSYYLGDLNTTHFYQPLPAAGLIIRKNIDRRFVYKTEVMFINLQSDERKSEDTIAKHRGLHFRSPVYELSGQLPISIKNLTAVRVISMTSNSLTGVLPVEIGYLKKLEELSLASNKMSGKIPKEIGKLSSLRTWSLKGNNFSGSLLADLA